MKKRKVRKLKLQFADSASLPMDMLDHGPEKTQLLRRGFNASDICGSSSFEDRLRVRIYHTGFAPRMSSLVAHELAMVAVMDSGGLVS